MKEKVFYIGISAAITLIMCMAMQSCSVSKEIQYYKTRCDSLKKRVNSCEKYIKELEYSIETITNGTPVADVCGGDGYYEYYGDNLKDEITYKQK